MLRHGCILSAWLGLVAICPAQDSNDSVDYVNEREWSIPVTLNEQIKRDAASLSLFVSADQGKTWKKETSVMPDEKFFKFNAGLDGQYWFSVAYTDRNGKQNPTDPAMMSAMLKMVVDTRKPQVKLNLLERTGESVLVGWDVREEHLDLNKLRIEYRTGEGTPWKSVVMSQPSSVGKYTLNVGTTMPVSIRMMATDLASNSHTETIDVPSSQVSPAASVPPPATSLSTNPASSLPAPGASLPGTLPPASTLPGATLPGNKLVNDGVTAPGSNLPAPLPGSGMTPRNDGFKPVVAGNTNVTSADTKTKTNNGTGPTISTSYVSAAVPNAPVNPNNAAMLPANQNQPGSVPPVKNRVPVRDQTYYSHSTHLELDFEVTQSPSGIGWVELYVTQDYGRTWQLKERKEEFKVPYTVDVEGEGYFGFTMVVKNKGGIGRKEPVSGDAPDITICVDTSAPNCELKLPIEPVPNRKELVTLRWGAEDANLSAQPIKLEWAASIDGPWKTIVEKHANVGRFEWRIPSDIPPQVFLRLEVTDMAGNVAQSITRDPVVVDLQEPTVKIKGLKGAVPSK